MESGGSSVGGTKGKGKGSGTRRKWNIKEEEILMEQLKELIAGGGWKSENGFRPGYLQKLEEKLYAKLPGTDLRATPHIHSRITIWKRQYAALLTALGDSGGGFNTETNVLDVSDIAWEKAVKKDPFVASMRYKPWPLYNDWVEVFGKDRVNGLASEDVMDVVNNLAAEDNHADFNASAHGNGNVGMEDIDTCDMDVESQAPTIDTSKPSGTPSSSKKRIPIVQNGANKELFEGLSTIFTTSDDRLDAMFHSIRVDSPTMPTKNIFSMIECIPNLTLDECLDASENLSKNPQRLEMFTGLSEVARERYIRRLLNGDFDKKV